VIICIDYDKTYTAAPDLWDEFIELAIRSGNKVICATMRHDTEGERISMNGVPIYYTSRKAKARHLMELGINPDIWIDDSPEWIFTNG